VISVVRNNNIFKRPNLINLMVEEKPESKEEKELEEKAEDLEEKQ